MTAHRSQDEPLVTSPAQDRAWHWHRLMPQSAEPNRCRQYAVIGPLDLNAIRRAWRIVSERHDILRTVFREVDGCPVPVVQPTDAVLRVVDLQDQSSWPEAEGAADRLVDGWVQRPFDPRTEVISVTVLVLDDANARLLLVADAMICDDKSVSIVARQLAEAYAAVVAGAACDSARDATVQYGTVAAVERRRAIPALARRTSASGDWAATPGLPGEHARPPAPWSPGRRARFEWLPELSALLTRTAGAVGVDRPVVMLAALHALLYHYGPVGRTAVAIPVTTRTASTREMIGPFDNVMVVAVNFPDVPTFRQLLVKVQNQVRAGLRYRSVPFEYIEWLAGGDRDPRCCPLYDAVFVCNVAPEPLLDLGGTLAMPIAVDNGTVPAGLSLVIDRLQPSVVGSVGYRTDTFLHASAERIASQLHTFVENAADRLDDPVDSTALWAAR